jgi:membrane protein
VLLVLAGLGQLLEGTTAVPPSPTELFERFLPPHLRGPDDPFAAAEALLGRIATFGQKVTLVAVPAFLWFATRAFASARTALNDIYDVSLRPVRRRHFVVGFLVGKGRDLMMVIVTILLFLASTGITTGLALAQAWGEGHVPGLGFWLSSVGRFLAEAVAFVFIVALFLILYRFGSQRRMPIRAAMVASLFAGAAFELARRLYALYLTDVASYNVAATDANLGAVILFVLWMYYSALVFLLGAVVAETWMLRHLQQRQRAV